MEEKKRKKEGRKLSFRLTEKEWIEFEKIFFDSGIMNVTSFIKSIVFNRPVKVVKVDQNTMLFLARLNSLQAKYKAIGNNYNQATKAIKTALSEKKALAFLKKLENEMIELIKLNNEIKQLTKELNEKWSQK